MRILILHSRYLSGPVSGENRVVQDEAAVLREAGHEVHVLSPAPEASRPADRAKAAASAVWSRRAAGAVGRLVRDRAIEIVHAHNLFPTLSPSVLRAARSAGAAVLVTLHNFRFMCLPATFLRDGKVCEACLGRIPWRGVAYRCYRGSAAGSATLAASLSLHRAVGSLDAVSRFLAVSGFVRAKHIEGGFPVERIGVKGNFTWPVERRADPGDHFLFLGRLAPEKGLDTLLGAWRAGGLGRLVVAGDGPEAATLRRQAPAEVDFIGQVPAEEVPALLRGAKALLVPSRWYEASPHTIIEAYAAGVPVIASRIGALPEAVADGVTGLLVEPEDAEAWAEAVRRVGVPGESKRLGAAAYDRWRERHAPEPGLRELEAAYHEAMVIR